MNLEWNGSNDEANLLNPIQQPMSNEELRLILNVKVTFKLLEICLFCDLGPVKGRVSVVMVVGGWLYWQAP